MSRLTERWKRSPPPPAPSVSLAAALVALAALAAAGGAHAAATPAAEPVPATVVGSWWYGIVAPTDFWDDHTGRYAGNAYGISDQYVFASDGTYTQRTYLYTQAYQCRTQVWVEARGTVRFAGASFAKAVQTGRFRSRDTCAASRNFDRPMTDRERADRSRSHEYALRTDAAGARTLQITGARYAPAD
ncbi:hypothetical protein tb265_47430 [Gemmatimonadetes bacterium T265]|nr:hypothetical protein tb265_47430 [Gemmatimonadetes bacterium T265]